MRTSHPATAPTRPAVEDDRIARDVVFCGGRWDPEVVAKMGSAAHAG